MNQSTYEYRVYLDSDTRPATWEQIILAHRMYNDVIRLIAKAEDLQKMQAGRRAKREALAVAETA